MRHIRDILSPTKDESQLRPSQSHGSSHRSNSARRHSGHYPKRRSERHGERHRPDLPNTGPEPAQSVAGQLLPERTNPLLPGVEGPFTEYSDNDTEMEDADYPFVVCMHCHGMGYTRPRPVACQELRPGGSCQHLEELRKHIEHGQVLQQIHDRMKEGLDARNREISRLGELESRERAAKDSLTLRLEAAEANLSRQTETAQNNIRQFQEKYRTLSGDIDRLWELGRRELEAKVSLARRLEVAETGLSRQTEAARAKTRQLEAKQSALTMAKSQLERADAEKNDFRRKWKQSVKELAQLAKISQPAAQVTDSDLDTWASQLRTAIRDFAIRYFESDAPFPDFLERFERAQGAAGFELMRKTTASMDELGRFLSSPTRRSAVIQSFMWRFLGCAVFSGFLWAGTLAPTVSRMHLIIRDAATDDETFKKFKSWAVITTKLLINLEGIDSKRETRNKDVKDSMQRQAGEILGAIAPFANIDVGADGYRDFRRELDGVLQRAIAMDRDVCRQAADISWEFSRAVPCPFDAETMAAERGEMLPSADSTVAMVIAPAMCKRGRSNGDHLGESPRVILPMEVTCRSVENVQ